MTWGIPDKAWEFGGYFVLLLLCAWAVRGIWKWSTSIVWSSFLEPVKDRLLAHCDRVEDTLGKLVSSSEAMSESMDSLSYAIKSTPPCRYPAAMEKTPPG